jgi:hypothetical protein
MWCGILPCSVQLTIPLYTEQQGEITLMVNHIPKNEKCP